MSDIFTKKIKFKDMIIFALPNICMMVFLSLYVIIDGIFISSKVNPDALGGVNIVFPIHSLMFALSIMIGSGGGALISKKLGEGKEHEARRNFTTLVILEVLISLIFLIFGNIFINEIVEILGGSMASEVQKEYGIQYLRIGLIFAPMVFLQCAFQTFFITVGKPTLGLIACICAGITNIVLDYIFIVVLQIGVAGAALATALGQCIPAIIGLAYFSFVRTNRLYFVKPKFEGKMILNACTNGSSEMLSNLSNAVTTFLFNLVFLSIFGDAGTSAITIILYFQFIIVAIFFGYSNGIAPVISYKYGEGKMEDVKYILKRSLIFFVALSLVMFTISLLIGGPIIGMFAKEGSTVYNIALNGLKFFVPAFLFVGFSILITGFFTALNDGLTSGVISVCRTLIFLSLSIIICSKLFGGAGAFASVAVAEVLGLIVAVVFLINKRKKYKY